VEAEGPSRGFSDIVWKESLPSALSAQSWWELVQQSLTIMVAKKATTWRITNTEITQVSPPLLLRRERDLKKGILWSWRTARSTDNRADGGGGGGGGGGSGEGGGGALISMWEWSLEGSAIFVPNRKRVGEGYLKEGVGALSSSSCGGCSVSRNGWAWREVFSSKVYFAPKKKKKKNLNL
jgi:hypothetical protein